MTRPPERNHWLGAALGRFWREFFHEPVDPRICALVRIGYCALVLVNLGVWLPHLDQWFGESGVLPYDVSRQVLAADAWSVLGWLPHSPIVLQACFWMFAFQTACLLMGLASRFNAVCVYVWLLSFQNRNVLLIDGEDAALRLIGFFLIFMPLGRAWSLDALWRKRPASPASGWALRLLQIQMAVIYMSAALVKLQGAAWINGTALYYVARLEDYFGRFPTPHWMFDTPAVVAVLTWSVIAVEFCVPLLIWFKETRLPCLVVVLLFHLASDYTMNLFLFHWVMLVGWMSFLTPADLERLVGVSRRIGQLVGYDKVKR